MAAVKIGALMEVTAEKSIFERIASEKLVFARIAFVKSAWKPPWELNVAFEKLVPVRVVPEKLVLVAIELKVVPSKFTLDKTSP